MLLYGGRVVAAGTPVEVLTTSRIEEVFQVRTDVDLAADGRPRIRYRRHSTQTVMPMT
ncbi:hypothetical protein ACQP0U_19705 [Micromonospora sp. CA-269861]|uniref:hypothetical protein n=1 Tax=Micromonospora sp. CA-269861 TaxID=3239968 RepID=UPI003D8EA703